MNNEDPLDAFDFYGDEQKKKEHGEEQLVQMCRAVTVILFRFLESVIVREYDVRVSYPFSYSIYDSERFHLSYNNIPTELQKSMFML